MNDDEYKSLSSSIHRCLLNIANIVQGYYEWCKFHLLEILKDFSHHLLMEVDFRKKNYIA